MNTKEIHEHFRSIGNWVNWDNTRDRILWGDGEAEVKKIAVCWSSNFHQLKEAKENGCNLYICHESLYYHSEGEEVFHQKEVEKRQFL